MWPRNLLRQQSVVLLLFHWTLILVLEMEAGGPDEQPDTISNFGARHVHIAKVCSAHPIADGIWQTKEHHGLRFSSSVIALLTTSLTSHLAASNA